MNITDGRGMTGFNLGSHKIAKSQPPFFIAEIGLNHNKDLEIGKRTIQKAKECGANAVKFQTYSTKDFIDPEDESAKFLFDIFQKYEIDFEFHKNMQKVANDEGLIFFSTPLDSKSVDLLVNLKVPLLKIASGDIVNRELLTKSVSTGLPLIISTGAALPHEIIRAIEFLEEKKVDFALLHCVSLYPTQPNQANLKTLITLQQLTDSPIGFSDHTSGDLAGAIAVSLGAVVLEKHFTLDRKAPGPDHSISADPNTFQTYVEKATLAYQMLGEEKLKRQPEELSGWYFGRRSLVPRDGKTLAQRPAKHLKDKKFLEAWLWED